jgi:hemerythrin-like domain-containing protein
MEKTETAFAEALGRAHTALLVDLRKLEEAIQSSAGEGLAELRSQLDTTRTHILAHFRFEERNGYMDTVRKREPRLERAIQLLVAEHQQLAQALTALIEQARGAPDLNARFRKQVQAWIERVRQHEASENDLVQDAFNQDIGPED